MLFRFSLYGFLKNQRYFEPFLVLAFLQKGLSFFQIGLLLAVREMTTILLEIPSGAIADQCGRRGSMILAFVAYLVCFLVLGGAEQISAFLPAMILYGVGDSFRTGTHKAMIFQWLRLQGREDERTRVYGYTRSWSKIGSAVSGLIAAAFVFALERYSLVFYAACIPCLFSIINFLGYPANLEGKGKKGSPKQVIQRMRGALGQALEHVGQRRLLLESMGYEGLFAAIKDYLQPVLQGVALLYLASIIEGSEARQTAILVGPVYMVLFLLSAYASRKAHVFRDNRGDDDHAAQSLWGINTALFGVMVAAAMLDLKLALVGCFVALYVLQNLWRPILVSRFDSLGDADNGATVLSIESQARRLATVVLAPLLGYLVDLFRGEGWGAFLPLALAGVIISGFFYLRTHSTFKRELADV